MLKKIISALVIIVISIAAIMAIIRLASGPEDSWICQEGAWVKHGNPKEPMPSVICSSPSVNASSSDDVSPDGSASSSVSENNSSGNVNKNITVTRPEANAELELPFSIRGRSNTFEGNVVFEIKEPSGRSLIKSCFMGGAYEMRAFEKAVKYLFNKPETPEAVLKVYDESPKDGSKIYLVDIPFTWAEQGLTTVKLFFSKQAAKTAECNQVFAVELVVPRSATPVRRSLDLLLDGTPCGLNLLKEEYAGILTNINSGVKVQSLSVEDGVARVDFNERLQEGMGGSCRVAAIRAQITQTLKQFSSINEVIISIDGRPEDILQP